MNLDSRNAGYTILSNATDGNEYTPLFYKQNNQWCNQPNITANREQNQNIKVNTPIDIQLLVDPERTRQILLNLLSNANKYSPSDSSITITTIAYSDHAEIIIEDEGPGIPEDHLSKVCNRFFQAPAEGAHLKGTGLGLAIVKEATKVQNGTVELKNRNQGGLHVCISLPKNVVEASKTPSPKQNLPAWQKE